MYKKSEIEKLIDNLDIVEVISEYVDLSKTGANFKGLSPFKEENTPSFVVSPHKNIFKDFSTGKGGNVLSFYMEINNLGFIQAIEELSRKYNILIKSENSYKKKEDSKKNKYYDILNETYKFYCKNILENENALKYMLERGYSKENVVKFGIGYSLDKWDSLYLHLKDKYDINDILALGLVKKSQTNNEKIYDFFKNRIMFPIFNKNSKIIGFGARQIEKDPNSPKYLNSPESIIFQKGNELYGLIENGIEIKKKRYAILMEGYLDVLTAHKHDFKMSVASLGTSLTTNQAKLLNDFTNNIIIAYDNDEAGKSAIVKAIEILNEKEFNIKCLKMSEGVKDPDEFLNKYGRKEFLEILKKSVDSFDFLFEIYSKNLDLQKIAAKQEIIDKFKSFFLTLKNQLYYKSYIEKLSIALSVDKEYLKKEYTQKTNINKNSFENKSQITKYKNTKNNDKRSEIEDLTIEFLVKKNEFSNMFVDKIFIEGFRKELFEKLKSINFDLKKIDINFNEEEKEYLFEQKLNNRSINEKDIASLLKGWLILEIDEYFDLFKLKDSLISVTGEERSKNFEITKIKKNINKLSSIEDIGSAYEEFKTKRGE